MDFHAHCPFYNSQTEKIDDKLGRARGKCSLFNSIPLIVSDKMADENEAPVGQRGMGYYCPNNHVSCRMWYMWKMAVLDQI